MSRLAPGTEKSASFGIEEAEAIRRELLTITQSDIFKRTRRSQEFLAYVVTKILEGRGDELKERVIGCALFGRAADYDTGTDSIVRVVANETRRRLQQYYQLNPESGAVRIDLLSGSYVPSIRVVERPAPVALEALPELPPPSTRRKFPFAWMMAACFGALCVFLAVQNWQLRTQRPEPSRRTGLPWSALFSGNRGIHILLADTSVGGIQNLLQTRLSLSDYLNRNFIPQPDKVDKKTLGFLRFLEVNQYTSVSYATTAIRIAQIAQAAGAPVSVSFAREMSLRTFKGGENFVVLGSSRANPWAQLFEPQLNFTLEYGEGIRVPVFHNRHPRPGEPVEYISGTPPGSTLHETYGHLAFLPSVFQGGSILFVTGNGSQATEATGELLTDAPRLNAALAPLKLNPKDPAAHFEILLRVRDTTGAPVRSEVAALR